MPDKVDVAETGIVEIFVDADWKPIYAGDPLTGTLSTTGAANFGSWYRDVPGINLSTEYPILLEDTDGEGMFVFRSQRRQQYPVFSHRRR